MRAIDALAHRSWEGQNIRWGGQQSQRAIQRTHGAGRGLVEETDHRRSGPGASHDPVLPKTVKVFATVVERGCPPRFAPLGLAWRLRRAKTAIPKKHVAARIKYCRWVLRQPQANLNRWTCVDGTSLPCKDRQSCYIVTLFRMRHGMNAATSWSAGANAGIVWRRRGRG